MSLVPRKVHLKGWSIAVCAAAFALLGSPALGETMEMAEFWRIIESAKLASPSSDERPEALRAALGALAPDEIQAFQELYIAKISEAYTWPLWGAAYIMNGGCSDDCFDYFRDWLISEGQTVYEAALKDPETLADLPRAQESELEEFRYVAQEVYEGKLGRAMEPSYPPLQSQPAGEAWDEETVDKLFPKLSGKYW